MIDYQHNRIVFECDTCGDALHTDTTDIDEANQERRQAGWTAQKVQGEWVHFCSAACAA